MGFKRAPKEIQEAFVALKHKLNKPLSLHEIYGCYYVYGYSSIRDQKKGKTVIKTFYLGSLSKDGRFVSKDEPKQTKQAVTESIRENDKADEREAITLRNLSMNGRMSMSKLAKRLKMSTAGARHFVKRLEEKYSVRYFAEIDTLKLGYLRYMALVKFEDKTPKLNEIKEAFEDDPHVALVAMTKGIHDMVVIFYLESTVIIANFIYEWRRTKALQDYTAEWYITPLDMASGITMPLRKQVTDWISETSSVAKGNFKSVGQLTKIEGLVLKEIMLNGAQDFRSIDDKYSLGAGRSNYAFYTLKEKGVIERITLTMTPPHLRYNAIFITKTNNYGKFTENQDQRRLSVISEDNPLINNYAFRGDMGAPDGIFQIRPIFDDSGFQKIREEMDSIKGTKTDTMIITDVVVGSLCYRNFDPTYTTVYEALLTRGKIQKQDKFDY